MSHISYNEAALPLRFWSKVSRGSETDCWEWTASRTKDGYGHFRWDGQIIGAHRVAYLTLVGPVPKPLMLDHLCRNRACVNPAHLEPVTNAVNQQRGAEATKTHCVHGHEFTQANTLPNRKASGRRCKTCFYAKNRRWLEANRDRANEAQRVRYAARKAA